MPRTDHVSPAGTKKSSTARAPLEVSIKRVEGIPNVISEEKEGRRVEWEKGSME
jgi:hypothetical protein